MRNKTIFRLSVLISLVFVCVVYFVYRLQIKTEPRETIWIPEPKSLRKLPPGAPPGYEWVQYMGEGPWRLRKIPEKKEKKPVRYHKHEPDWNVHEHDLDYEHPPIPKPEPTQPVSHDYKPVQVEIPEGITDPEVKKAWERVQYISENIWEWGGHPSDRAVQLIHQLMPPHGRFTGPTAHRDVEDTINLLSELIRTGDPRAAETLTTYLCEGLIGGNNPIDALVEIGPPAVPYLIPYVFDDTSSSILRGRAIRILGRIAVKHRKDLGGVVEHIIIPKFEEITKLSFTGDHNIVFPRNDAREALERLK